MPGSFFVSLLDFRFDKIHPPYDFSAEKLFAGSDNLCFRRFPVEFDLHDALPATLGIIACQKPGAVRFIASKPAPCTTAAPVRGIDRLPCLRQACHSLVIQKMAAVFQNGEKVFKKKTKSKFRKNGVRNYERFSAKWATISSMSMSFRSESFRLIS